MTFTRPCTALFCLFICLFSVTMVSAADWTDTAFPIKNHDFGTVAVSAKTDFRFPVVNPLGSPIHIQTVRASCGCTTPTVLTPDINPGETGVIHAKFNTHTFKGKKGATLTVVIDRPFYREVRLRVDGYIRSDIVFSPGAIDFGKISQGEPATKSSKLYYAGRNTWEIMDVQSNRSWLKPTITELSRANGRVNYELTVAIGEQATGRFTDEIVIITNDKSKPRVPIRVSGEIESPLTVSPKSFTLGSLKPGEPRRQQLVLVGKKPFTVTSIEVDGWNVNFNPANDPKKMHVVVAEFTPNGKRTGQQTAQLRIMAQGEGSIAANAILTAEVRGQ